MTSLGMVLEQYPDEVIVYVTDPRTGVQRKSKWPPTISEIVEACDGRVAELARIDRFENFARIAGPALLEPPREKRLSKEELKAKYGPNWGLDPIDTPSTRPGKEPPAWDKIAEDFQSDPNRLARLLKRDA